MTDLSPDRWKAASPYLDEALALPEGERAAYVAALQAKDPSLAADLQTLLNAHHGAAREAFLEESPTQAVGSPGLEGRSIGGYTIRRLIAEGGMGAVYEAQQKQPRRQVALKLIRSGIVSPSTLKRFEYEAELLARLRHPGIAQVYEAGTHDDGTGPVPFFAMEYVAQARPITRYVLDNRLDTRQRLELFLLVCDAVHHGHQKGIIHRDLKPSNILVDASGQPKVIDFGVARSTDSDIAATVLTSAGQLVGTLQYMSPEQCQADPQDIDTRSDVYALGLVLYEMLCGRLPYEVSGAAHEVVRVIQEQPPARLGATAKHLRGDLETIVLKALEKDRRRRYQSAADMALDLRRYLRNDPILARPASAVYQFRKFAQRNRALVAGVAGIIVALAAGVLASTGLYFRSEQSRSEAEAVVQFLGGMLAGVDPRVGRKDITVREVLDRAAATVDSRFKDKPLTEAYLHQTMANSYLGLGIWDEAEKHAAAAAALRLAAKGPEDPTRLESMILLAYALDRQAKYEPALDVLDELIPSCRRQLGEESPLTLSAMFRKAVVLLEQRRFQEAEALHHRIYEMRLRVLGPDDPETLASAYYLAECALRQRRLAEAETLMKAVLADRQRVLGAEHPDTLHAMNDLGWSLNAQQKYAEAAAVHRQTLEIRRRVLGAANPDTLMSASNLAYALGYLGQHREAQELFVEALEGYRRVLGEAHWRTINAMASYASWLLTSDAGELRNPRLARELAEKAVEGTHRTDPVYLETLAQALLETGDKDQAVAAQRAALEILTDERKELKQDMKQSLAEDMIEARRLPALAPFLSTLHEKRIGTGVDSPPKLREYAMVVVDLYETWHTVEPGHGYDDRASRWRAQFAINK
jgi:non-specific serine/threonine protein kinase/serine/threonine-protein kinase